MCPTRPNIFTLQPCAGKVCQPPVEREPGGPSLAVVWEDISVAATLNGDLMMEKSHQEKRSRQSEQQVNAKGLEGSRNKKKANIAGV